MNQLVLAYAAAIVVAAILIVMAVRNVRRGYRSRPDDLPPQPLSPAPPVEKVDQEVSVGNPTRR